MRYLAPIALAASLLAPALAQAAAGQVLFALGRVEIQRGDQTVVARRGTTFEPGDSITTGPTGMAQLRFKDGALMSLRHGSTLKVEDFHFPEPTANPAALTAAATARQAGSAEGGRSVLRLVRGAFRTITGLIGKGSNDQYRVVTPAATIGIRGTDYTAAYCEANCGSSEDGLYVGVSSGEITVQNDAGEMPVSEGEYSYTKDAGTPPEQEMSPPEALDQPPPTEEEGEGEGEGGEEPPPEGTTEGTEEGSAEGEGSTDSGSESSDSSDSGTTDSGSDGGSTDTAGDTDTASSDGSADSGTTTSGTSDSPPPPTETSSTTTTTTTSPTTTESVPPPPPPPPETYSPPTATTTAASYAFAYSATRGTSTNGVVLSGADVVRFTQSALTYEIGTAVNKNQGFDSASGLRWGRWSGGSATKDGVAISLASESLHWIYAASPTAPVIPMSGTANFTLVGNTNPTNTAGQVGFLGSASLTVCFTCGTVNSSLNIGINNQVWNASGSGSLANANTLFSGTYGVTVSGGGTGTGTGGFTGFLSGTAAGLGYNLNALSTTVSGTAAFVQQGQ